MGITWLHGDLATERASDVPCAGGAGLLVGSTGRMVLVASAERASGLHWLRRTETVVESAPNSDPC